jgi:hypothetical protein
MHIELEFLDLLYMVGFNLVQIYDRHVVFYEINLCYYHAVHTH